MSRRLPPVEGEWIDRNAPVSCTFEGRPITGYRGDSITAALLASGETVLGRSFKYHRPRSALSAANHDANVMVETSLRTNIRGDVEAIEDGEVYNPVNVFGSLQCDYASLLQKLKRFLPVGFYYKAFYRPKGVFRIWERYIRAIAGLGKVSVNWRSERLISTHKYIDVLVIGSGASGMTAALAAAEAGVRVILADENFHIGGSLHYQGLTDSATRQTFKRLIAAVAEADNITVITGAEACGYYGHHLVPLVTRQGIIKVQAKAVVVATGVFEQPAVFGNNDIPGVMLASGAQRIMARYAIKPCERAVVLAGNSEAYRAALDLVSLGIEVAALVDIRAEVTDSCLFDQVSDIGIPVLLRSAIYEVAGGRAGIQSVEVCPLSDHGVLDRTRRTLINADGVITSVGFAPAGAALYQAGVRFCYDEAVQQLVPDVMPAGLFAAGRVNGVFDLTDKCADGRACGAAAAAHALGRVTDVRSQISRATIAHSHPYPIFDHHQGWNFVDMDEDLTLKDLTRAIDEGFDNIELLKRFSTIGMGPSQGKHSNMNGIRILARKREQSIDATGSTTARPMFHPVPIKALGGQRLRPMRRTALHAFHVMHGAQFMETGQWYRPQYYGDPAQHRDATQCEVTAVRSGVGLIDISTLGKIEIFGPDTLELVSRLYTMRTSNIREGMTGYALMVDETGIVIDDGVAARLSENRFYVTTTSGTSDTSFAEIQRRILEWNLDVDVLNLTGQLGAINIVGPLSRRVLARFTDVDLDPVAFPYLAVRQGRVCEEPAMLIRTGFVGELGFEIHMAPAALQAAVVKLMEAGAPEGIRPFGLEALRMLRLEKGHLIVGQDTDGLTNPFEAGLSWAVDFSKDYFVGKRSLEILQPIRRRSLVGFQAEVNEHTLKLAECHLVIANGKICGRVTSVGNSTTIGRVIGLAYVDDETHRDEGSFEIRISDGHLVSVQKAVLPFYDPEGIRQKKQVETGASSSLRGDAE